MSGTRFLVPFTGKRCGKTNEALTHLFVRASGSSWSSNFIFYFYYYYCFSLLRMASVLACYNFFHVCFCILSPIPVDIATVVDCFLVVVFPHLTGELQLVL